MGREMRWWGWGEDAHAGAVSERPWPGWRASSARWTRPAAPVALEDVRLDDPRLPGARARALRRDPARRPRRARAARARQVLSRPRAPARGRLRRARRTPSSRRATTTRCAPCSRHARARASRSCPSAAARAWSAASSRCARASTRSSRSTSGRSTRSRRSTSARSWPWWAAGCAPSSSRRALGERGFTLGHYPQSYEYVTIGGCAATRSAGQASTGYGRIDELVVGVRLAAPAGDLDLRAQPASAAGPELRRLVVGSEGVLGAITRVALRVRPAPELTPLRGLDVRRASARAPRRCGAWSRAARRPTWRGSPTRTRPGWGSAWPACAACARGALRAYLRARGVAGGALAIVGWAGPEEAVRVRREAAVEALRDAGGVALGQPAGRAWVRSRFHGPYLRDELMDRGVMVETLETATTWAQLFTLYRAVGDVLRDARAARRLPHLAPLSDGRVAVLHLHGAGAARRGARAVGRGQGGGVRGDRRGRRDDHPSPRGGPRPRAATSAPRSGATGVAALRALKRELDPAGVMNPGKLLPVGLAAGGALDRPAQVDRARRGRVVARSRA